MFNDLRRYETMRARFAKLAVAHCEVEVSSPCERSHFKRCATSAARSCPPHLSMRVQGDWGFELCYDDNGCLNVANNIGAVHVANNTPAIAVLAKSARIVLAIARVESVVLARAHVERQPTHPAVTSLIVTVREGAVAGEGDQHAAVLLSEDVSTMSNRMVKPPSPN